VDWTLPTENHFSVVEYEISISDSGGTFQVDTDLCDGSDSDVITNLYCIVPMASLVSSPYSLSVGTVVAFKVRARNARGWSALSSANTNGVLAQTVPVSMAAPSTIAANTDEQQVYAEWVALSTSSETGGSAVTSYHLSYDSGTSGGTWTDVLGYSPASLVTSTTLTSSIVAGTTYLFRVRASNMHGWGGWSP
jgi:hypothetical protein